MHSSSLVYSELQEFSLDIIKHSKSFQVGRLANILSWLKPISTTNLIFLFHPCFRIFFPLYNVLNKLGLVGHPDLGLRPF